MSRIKINRAQKLSKIGDLPQSFAAMLAYVPDAAIVCMTSAALAQMIDALWSACQNSKIIANQEALAEGAIWDAKNQKHREISMH